MALEREIEQFYRELPTLLGDPAQAGKYVLIGGDPPLMVGVYPAEEDAIRAGYERFGLAAVFLVRQVARADEPKYFSRNLRCAT